MSIEEVDAVDRQSVEISTPVNVLDSIEPRLDVLEARAAGERVQSRLSRVLSHSLDVDLPDRAATSRDAKPGLAGSPIRGAEREHVSLSEQV